MVDIIKQELLLHSQPLVILFVLICYFEETTVSNNSVDCQCLWTNFDSKK